ncbi:hypothetical protein GKIL_0352 [Gloeobacter kilaueensis JS1]|uniref:Uncharacterized protein n=2 Tax=Gloeobacter TaxID=33071 RepID=U5QG28_GLOK1|nr:hypothetical protein GKIL_0352 [Gloeobacter kilaueensis JS1]
MNTLQRMAAPAVLLILVTPVQAQMLRSAPAPQLKTSLQASPQITMIPAGTQANLIVLLSPGSTLPLMEDRPVTIAVGGQIGEVALPQGTFLVGKLTRAEDSKAILHFESLLVGNRIYTVQATSAPLDAQMVYDRAAAQQAQARANAVQSQGQTTNALIQTGTTMAHAVGGFGLGSLFGAVGSLAGSAQQAQANNEAARIAASAQKLSASVTALQTLSVQFQSEVDLKRPFAELPSSIPPTAGYMPGAPPPGYPPAVNQRE